MHIRRVVLYTAFVSLALAALLGASGILGVVAGELAFSAVSTMVLVAMSCGIAVAAFDAIEKHVWRPLMVVALIADAVAVALILALVWLMDLFSGSGISDDIATLMLKAAGVAGVLAVIPVTAAHTAMLNLPARLVIARRVCVAVLAVVAVMMIGAIVLEVEAAAYYQLMGILVIAGLFGIIALRLTQRMQALDKNSTAETTPMALSLTCPRCLLEQTVSSGVSRCRRCRLKFTVEIEEPRCPQCEYVLHMLTEPRCPECGFALAPEEIADRGPAGVGAPAAVAGAAAGAAGVSDVAGSASGAGAGADERSGAG